MSPLLNPRFTVQAFLLNEDPIVMYGAVFGGVGQRGGGRVMAAELPQ